MLPDWCEWIASGPGCRTSNESARQTGNLESPRLKDGRTALAYKAEPSVYMERGGVVAVTTHAGAAAETESCLAFPPARPSLRLGDVGAEIVNSALSNGVVAVIPFVRDHFLAGVNRRLVEQFRYCHASLTYRLL